MKKRARNEISNSISANSQVRINDTICASWFNDNDDTSPIIFDNRWALLGQNQIERSNEINKESHSLIFKNEFFEKYFCDQV